MKHVFQHDSFVDSTTIGAKHNQHHNLLQLLELNSNKKKLKSLELKFITFKIQINFFLCSGVDSLYKIIKPKTMRKLIKIQPVSS